MKKGKRIKSRALAWALTFVMVLSMAPNCVSAEENTGQAGCTHIHDESCGYVEAMDEVQCDKNCVDDDGDGIIDHAENCAYAPAVVGQECNHVHDENCGGLTEDTVATLQERINSLPSVDEYRAMTEDEQNLVYEEAAEISDEYIELSEEEQGLLDITRMEELFAAINEDIALYNTSGTVTFLNSGYPYGKNMNRSNITLVIEVEGTASSYQWQYSTDKNGSYNDISGATYSTYTFAPTSGYWYRCVVDGTASEAVMAVYPGRDGRTWTNPYSSWYIGNGTMAYMASGTIFDAVGKYSKNGTDYMLCTSYGMCWNLFSNTSASPSAGDTAAASLDALRVSFNSKDDYAIIFEADLADGQQALAFGCDTQLGNSTTSNGYHDKAALTAMVKNGVLQQVSMIGAASVERAADDDPAFVIAPMTPASRFWIGRYSSRQTYAYNTSGGTATETIDGQNVVTLLEGIDSGMTMSWMNIPSGGSVKFQFSVGDVASTGAISGKVNYEEEKLTGLDPNTTYDIIAGNDEYTIISDEKGEIPLAGTDKDGKPYDFTGETITVSKKGSTDTPAEIEIEGRPDTPDKPSDLEDDTNKTPTVDSNIEIVELTTTSVTISPKEGQQYAYSADGTNWINLTATNGDGNYVVTGLTEGSIVQIKTRIPATSEKPASQWSTPTSVTLKTTVKASAVGWSSEYDGESHCISVNVTAPLEGATIMYSDGSNDSYSETNPTFDKAGEYTVYYRVMADGCYPAYGSATVSITQKVAELSWTNTAFTYDGHIHTPVAMVSNLLDGDICTVTVTGGQKNYSAYAYTATAIGLTNLNYKLPDTVLARQKSFTIDKKEIGVTWNNTEFTYDGTAHKPTATLTGVVPGDNCGVTVSGEHTNAGTGYVATAQIDNTNYILKTEDATTTFVIKPKTLTADMISLDRADKSYAVTGGDITPIVTVKDGSATLVTGEDKDYVLSGDTSHSVYGNHTITVTGKGNYTGSATIDWRITDPYAPSGAISVSSKIWSSTTTDSAFANFFKNFKKVSITATDGEKESGVDKVYYYLSDVPYTDATDLSGLSWTEIENGGYAVINANAKVYVYAKITDKAGNVTYISTNGMVIYKDSAKATEEITFTKTSATDVTADVVLNGNTISKITLGDTTLVKDRDYAVSANGSTITFKASYLQTLAAGADYTFKVSYNPGGETYVDAVGNDKPLDTEIKLNVKRAQGSLTDISDISKTYDGDEVTEPTFTTTNTTGTENANVTFEYKAKDAENSTYTSTKPVNAGAYVVKVTVAADENYEEVSATAEFTISKAAITAAAADYAGVYDGTVHGITVNVTGIADDYSISYGVMADGEITYGDAPVTYKDAGTYTVYYKISSANYNDKTGSADITIEPKTIGISWSDDIIVYDGGIHTPTVEATGLVSGDVCDITVTGGQKNAGTGYVATATAVSNPNYKLPEAVTTEYEVSPADITVTAVDTSKHIGKTDPVFTYSITKGTLVEGDTLSGITLLRETGELSGKYMIAATAQSGSNPNYNITFTQGKFTIEDHIAAVDAVVAPTCTETGLTEGSHCSVCDKVLVAQEVVPVLGHDFSGEWKVIREATEAAEGKKELTCSREGCGYKKYDVIPAIGTTEEPVDPNAGDIEKYTEVSADAPVQEATLGNKKSELLTAPSIFTETEKEEIKQGADAMVWLEITGTGEASIPEASREKIIAAAKQIMGDELKLTYFDAELFKQIADGEKTKLHEPGIPIKVTVKIPNELLNTDKSVKREYKIIRLHNGELTVLGGSFNAETGEFSFETDKFSTYAIAYSDTVIVPEADVTPTKPAVTDKDVASPDTGDAARPFDWALLMLISIAAMARLYNRKKKY